LTTWPLLLRIKKGDEIEKIFISEITGPMDQFRNDVALWVNKLRGRYDAIFIEPENVSKIS
jgi:hypothetical protein